MGHVTCHRADVSNYQIFPVMTQARLTLSRLSLSSIFALQPTGAFGLRKISFKYVGVSALHSPFRFFAAGSIPSSCTFCNTRSTFCTFLQYWKTYIRKSIPDRKKYVCKILVLADIITMARNVPQNSNHKRKISFVYYFYDTYLLY